MAARFIAQIPHDSYPTLQWRKKLAARLLIARNFSSKGRKLKRAILEAANESARDPTRSKDNSERLDDFLRDVLSDAKHAGNLPSQRKSNPGIDEAFHEFETDLSRISCYDCVRDRLSAVLDDLTAAPPDFVKSHICNGGNDDINLTEHAACLLFLSEIFIDLVEIAEYTYLDLLQNSGDDLHVFIKFRPTEKRGLAASTIFKDTHKKRNAVIEITLPTEDLDHRQYYDIPYFIFHEVCVHAPEAWDFPEERPLLATPSTCPLREGFVDAAAAYILDRALAQDKLGSVHHRFKEQFQLATRRSSSNRAVPPAELEGSGLSRDQFIQEITDARNRGQVLFLKLAAELGDDAAAHLAFALNLLSLDDDCRDQLVTELTLALEARPLPDQGADMAAGDFSWLQRLSGTAQAGKLGDLRDVAESLIGSQEF